MDLRSSKYNNDEMASLIDYDNDDDDDDDNANNESSDDVQNNQPTKLPHPLLYCACYCCHRFQFFIVP